MKGEARSRWIFALVALVGATLLTRGLIAGPGFTDAFYHFNAAARLADGDGLTDPYLWMYINAPDALPAPSHTYWMPFTSLSAAAGMALLGRPGDYGAAQWPFTLMLAGTAGVGFWLGGRIGGTARHAWVAGLLTLFSGFFTRFWGATDTFAPYALVGSLCLVALGVVGRGTPRLYVAAGAAGALAGLAHLTRADGVLLLLVGWAVALWPFGTRHDGWGRRLAAVLVMTAAYTLVMLPWFARNVSAMGTPLPVGGAQGIWYTEYNDLFSYPADANAATFFGSGVGRLWATRWEAFTNNLGTFIAVEGMIVMTPLMLLALWRRRADPFLRGFWLYALGLHLAMTLVFPFPGYRGGLLHSAAALVPWWAALGVAGLDDAVEWVATRRRRWRAGTAKLVFSAALVGFAVYLSLSIGLRGRVSGATPPLYTELDSRLPADARVMINDPAQLYTFTGRGGVVLPNEAPEVIREIARRYDVDYLVLEYGEFEGRRVLAAPTPLLGLLDNPPEFLDPLPLDTPNARLYGIKP